MQIKGSVALVTGANRGLGRHFAEALLARGAAKIYATARRPSLIDLPGVEVLELDVTDEASVSRAGVLAQDVTLLINNAGASTGSDLVSGDLALIRQEMDTFFWGSLGMIRTFAPVLKANGGGGVLNINSAMSWVPFQGANAYHVAKAAQWALTNAVRLELAEQGTYVGGAYFGMTDTGHQEWWNGPLNNAAELVGALLDGFEAGTLEIIPDELGAGARAQMAMDPAEVLARG